GIRPVSQLNPWPVVSPGTLHGCPREQNLVQHSGSGRLAKPSPWGTSTSYSLPASWRTPSRVNRVHDHLSPAVIRYAGVEQMVVAPANCFSNEDKGLYLPLS